MKYMNIRRFIFSLVAASVLAAGAVALSGNSDAKPVAKLACGSCGGQGGCSMKMSAAHTQSVHPLSSKMISQIAGGKLTEKNQTTVAAALKHHQAVVRQANSELVLTVGKALNLNAKQKKELQCAVDGCTGNCSDKGCSPAASSSGSSCPMSGHCCTMSGKTT